MKVLRNKTIRDRTKSEEMGLKAADNIIDRNRREESNEHTYKSHRRKDLSEQKLEDGVQVDPKADGNMAHVKNSIDDYLCRVLWEFHD